METVKLTRDVEAIQIPAGHPVTLEAGWDVIITQSLGGSYTVQVPMLGGLFRIAGADADAIGKPVEAAPSAAAGGDLEAQVWEALKTCYDPEIPVNIVDLGLVYDMRISDAPDGGRRVDVKMTLTAPGCPVGPQIAAEIEQKLRALGASAVSVDFVWTPPWTTERVTPDGKLQLQMMGIPV